MCQSWYNKCYIPACTAMYIKKLLLKLIQSPLDLDDDFKGKQLPHKTLLSPNEKPTHSVLERIWVKGSYLSQWLPQGERRPPKESKSQ